MTVHRVIDTANAVLAGAFLAYILPETPTGKIAQAAGTVIVSYPALESLFSPGRYWRFAMSVVGLVAFLELTVAPSPRTSATLTWGVLAAALLGWLLTRRRASVRDRR